jgi:hypothetical protein
VKDLRKAKSLYQKVNNLFGVAKVSLVIAEFYIEGIYGAKVNVEFDEKKLEEIKAMILDAIDAFRRLKMEALEARSLKINAILELKYSEDSLLKAKNKIEMAKEIAERINDHQSRQEYTKILNEILHKIHIKASNVFIFAKAFPLVEDNGSNEITMAGSFTRHMNAFRTNLISGFEELNKVVNVKFDSLNREVLDYIKKFGCRVLHLSSDVYREDHLCIEGSNGRIEYIHINDLKTILKPPNNQRLNVNLVVLAIPDSRKLA